MKFKYRQREFTLEGASSNDYIYRRILNTRTFYEIGLLEYIACLKSEFKQPHSTAIDVGANIGNHSIFLGCFIVNHVIAIEPNPLVLPVLEQNLRNNMSNYHLTACALGDEAGMADISMPADSEVNIGRAQLAHNPHGSVPVYCLDKLMETIHHQAAIRIIKIDVEGMELQVLKGAIQTLTQHKPHLFLEAMDQKAYEQLKAFLQPLGYSCMSCHADTPVYHFAFKPSTWLRSRVLYAQLLLSARRLLQRLLQRLQGTC